MVFNVIKSCAVGIGYFFSVFVDIFNILRSNFVFALGFGCVKFARSRVVALYEYFVVIQYVWVESVLVEILRIFVINGDRRSSSVRCYSQRIGKALCIVKFVLPFKLGKVKVPIVVIDFSHCTNGNFLSLFRLSESPNVSN